MAVTEGPKTGPTSRAPLGTSSTSSRFTTDGISPPTSETSPSVPFSPPAPAASDMTSAQQRQVAQMRAETTARYRPLVASGAAPIRVMARMVKELQQACRKLALPEELIAREIADRTIGDVDLRKVTERDGATDYTTLADEFGVALPGEVVQGRAATGETYLWLRQRMLENERMLLAQGIDLRIYDIFGVGNPMLRGWLAEEMTAWGIAVPPEQVYLSIGAMDGVDKSLRGLLYHLRSLGHQSPAILFPAPGFNVPEWQAKQHGYRLHRVVTRADDGYKLTAAQLAEALEQAPDLHVVYLTISNNPTAFAFTGEELAALYDVVLAAVRSGRDLWVLADLAYIGTGEPAEDRERMRAFARPEALKQTVCISSLSKTHSLTGERMGWVTVGDASLAQQLTPAWTNSTASLPGEWQLRFMAYLDLIRERPWLGEKLRALYALRRTRLQEQLRRLDAEHHLFARINLDDHTTVYNWSELRPGEDVFSLFEKTGIAGVPGSGFGYSDEYVRLSVGVVPAQ
jgi:aspartate/methionine/tyrosine aminotransferase